MCSKPGKRRSSFVCGRRSQCFSSVDAVERFLPVGISEDEKRLRICLENSLDRLSREFPHLEEFEQFRVKVRSKFGEKVKEVEQQLKSDPAKEIERQMTALPKYINKLKDEQKTWDEMVEQRKQLAEQAQALADSVNDHPISDAEGLAISALDRKFLNGKLDYCNIYKEVCLEYEKTALAMEKLSGCVSLLEEATKNVSKGLGERAQQLHEHAFPRTEYNPVELLLKFQDNC